jgi:hypothetical protein
VRRLRGSGAILRAFFVFGLRSPRPVVRRVVGLGVRIER